MGDWVDDREQKKKEEGIHCIICDKRYKNAYGLANHVSKTHRMPFSEYKEKVLERAEREVDTLKAFADEVSTPVEKFTKGGCRNIVHLFELLKEGWK